MDWKTQPHRTNLPGPSDAIIVERRIFEIEFDFRTWGGQRADHCRAFLEKPVPIGLAVVLVCLMGIALMTTVSTFIIEPVAGADAATGATWPGNGIWQPDPVQLGTTVPQRRKSWGGGAYG